MNSQDGNRHAHGLGVKGKYCLTVVLMRKAGGIRGVYRTRSALPGKADLA